MQPTHHRIIQADARYMAELPDESVHLVVATVPEKPFREKHKEGPVAFGHTLEAYIDNLNLVWNECARVLHPGCRLCVITADPFTRVTDYGRYRIVPVHTTVIRFCEAAGLDYMGGIISSHEPGASAGAHLTALGSFPYPRNGVLMNDFDYILVFRKPGKGPAVTEEMKMSSGFSNREWNSLFAGSWNIAADRKADRRNSPKEEIPSRLIRMFSFLEETVLDPFVVDGAVSVAAMRVGRDSIGYEAGPQRARAARNRLVDEKGLFDQETRIDFETPERDAIDWAARAEALPWRYREILPPPPPPEPKKPRRAAQKNEDDVNTPPKKRGRPRKQPVEVVAEPEADVSE